MAADIRFKEGDHVRPKRSDFHHYQGVIDYIGDTEHGVIATVLLDVPCPQNPNPKYQDLHQDILELVP